MGTVRRILQNRKGDVFIFIFIIIFFILTLSAMLMEYFRMESLYQQVEYVLQRGVNSATEYAMMDDYRRDGYARMDAEVAEEKLYEYLHDSMSLDAELNKYIDGTWDYQLEVKSISATESPPKLILTGELKTQSIFSFLAGEVHLPFSITSANTRTTEGGSE